MNSRRLLTWENTILSIVALTAGASIMVLEIIASRIIAPFFGSSYYIWTNLIGVILICLSLGYYLGGKYADREPSFGKMGNILLIASISTFVSVCLKDWLLSWTVTITPNTTMNSIIAIIGLFAIPSTFLAMMAPYIVRLSLHRVEQSGRTVGFFYALSTVGSILGTFVSGYFLIPFIGTTYNLVIIGLVLLLLGFSVKASSLSLKFIALISLLFLIIFSRVILQENDDILADIETHYNRVRVVNMQDHFTKRPIRILTTDVFAEQSAVFTDTDNDLVYRYTRYYRLGDFFNPSIKHALMIGGGGYSYPKDFLKSHPNSTIDVVEIDEDKTEIARLYFNLRDDSRLTIYHEDGRVFLNKSNKTYDSIYLDVAASYTPPFYLLTQEATQRIYKQLTPEGVLITNTISSLEGSSSRLLRSVYKTYSSVFPHVYMFPVWSNEKGRQIQNVMVIAVKNAPQIFTSFVSEYNDYLATRWVEEIPDDVIVLTDEFAPIEYYQKNILTPYLLNLWL